MRKQGQSNEQVKDVAAEQRAAKVYVCNLLGASRHATRRWRNLTDSLLTIIRPAFLPRVAACVTATTRDESIGGDTLVGPATRVLITFRTKRDLRRRWSRVKTERESERDRAISLTTQNSFPFRCRWGMASSVQTTRLNLPCGFRRWPSFHSFALSRNARVEHPCPTCTRWTDSTQDFSTNEYPS